MNAADSSLPALRLVASTRPLVIGHRGYSQIAPENTLPSFKLAMAAGADLVELDYYHTKDGKLIVMHDADLDRTTDATNRWGGKKLKLESKTAAEIQSLDAGKWFDPKYGGTRVPLLAEALDTIHAGGAVTLIERKAGAAPTAPPGVDPDGRVGQAVQDECALPARGHEPRPAQRLQVRARVLDGQPRTPREHLDGLLALGEEVEQLQARGTGHRPTHAGEVLQQFVLCGSQIHRPSPIHHSSES